MHFLFQLFNLPIVFSDTGTEYLKDNIYDNIFVVDNFSGDVFSQLYHAGHTIMGSSVLIEHAAISPEINDDEVNTEVKEQTNVFFFYFFVN